MLCLNTDKVRMTCFISFQRNLPISICRFALSQMPVKWQHRFMQSFLKKAVMTDDDYELGWFIKPFSFVHKTLQALIVFLHPSVSFALKCTKLTFLDSIMRYPYR